MRVARVVLRLSAPVVATMALFAAPVAHAAPGLVGAYGFEEPSGTTATDTSGAGNPGAIAGATRAAAGRFGAALSFDGVDDRVNVNDSNALDLTPAMTLSAWVRPTNTDWRTVLLKERPGGLVYALYASTETNRPSAEVSTAGTFEARGTAMLPASTWSHLTTTYDGAMLRLYVNGTQVATRTVSGSIAVSSGALRIGGNAIWGEYFRGLIDEVRVYNRALSVTEVQADMNAPVVNADAVAPSKPGSLVAALSGDDVALSWAASTDNVAVTGYRVYRGATLLTTTTSLSFVDTDPLAGTNAYTVRAIDAAGNESAASDPASISLADVTPPTASANLVIPAPASQPVLTWLPATDNVGVYAYRIHRSTTSNFTPSDANRVAVVGGSTTTYTDTPPAPGGYYYRVVAVDAAGNVGPPSPQAGPFTVVGPPPPPVTGITATTTSTRLRLTWEQPEHSVPMDRYEIHRSTTDPNFVAATSNRIGTTTSRTFDDLTAPLSGPIYYRIVGTDTSGGKSSSTVFNTALGPDTFPPTVEWGSRCRSVPIQDRWLINMGVPDDRPGATLEILVDGVMWHGPTLGGISRDWGTWEMPDGMYEFTAVGRDAAGNEASDTCTVVIDNPEWTIDIARPADGATVSGVVEIRTETREDGTLRTGPQYTGSVYVDGVRVFSPEAWDSRSLPNGTHTIRTDLILAYNSSNHVFATDTIEIVVDNSVPDTVPPSAPGRPSATPSIDNLDVQLSWAAATDDVGIGAYRIYRTTVSGSTPTEFHRVATVTGTTFTDTVPSANVYYWVVVAVDSSGNTSTPSPERGQRVSGPILPKPANATATAVGTSIQLAWDQPAYAYPLAPYRIYRSTSPSGFTQIGTSSQPTFTDPNPPLTGTIYYQIVAYSTIGTFSEPTSIQTSPVPDTTPPTVTITQGCNYGTIHDYVPIRATVTDDRAGVQPYEVLIDGAPAHMPQGADWESKTVSNGSHVLSVRARDAAGNLGTASCDIVVHNPLVTADFAAPADGATVRGVVTLQLDPRADGAPLTGGDMTWLAVTISPTGSASGSGVQKTRTWDTTTVPNGVYTLRLDVGWLDYSTPRATKTISVTVDNTTITPDTTPPVVALTNAACDGHTVFDYVDPLRVSASDDRGGPVSLEVFVDDTRIRGPVTVSPGPNAYQFQWNTRSHTDGEHTMKLVAHDEAGNEGTFDCLWTVDNKDLSIPIVVSDSPVSGTVTVRFQPKADGADVTTPVAVTIDGATVFSKPGGPYEYTWDTTTAANGVHTIEAKLFWSPYNSPLATATKQVTVQNTPPAPTGLVAAYGFEETSGAGATDSSPAGSTGTISGAVRSTDGRFGRALSFDGVNDLVNVPDANTLDLTTGMTLSAWVRPTALGDWRTVVMKNRPGGLAYALYAHTDTNRPAGVIQAASELDARGGTSQLPLNAWTHLATTYDGTNVRLYINGALAATRAATGSITVSTGALQIGGNSVWSEWFKGLIDEVRVYSRALSAAEVSADRDRPVVAAG